MDETPSGATQPSSGEPIGAVGSPRGSVRAFVGVGSNINPAENVFDALGLLEQTPGITVVGISTFYRTPALPAPGAKTSPGGEDPDYLNGVLELDTDLDSTAFSKALVAVETALGRVRGDKKFASRTMDLDLLLFLPSKADDPGKGALLPVDPPPHPEVRSRAFVAIPLLELAPDLLLPPDGTPLSAVAASFPGPGGEVDGPLTDRLRRRFLSS